MQNTGGRVYKNVQPDYRWVPGVNIDLLIVDLTAFKNETEFKKEHLRVQKDGHGHLKVSGERPLGDGQGGAADKWVRFEKVFRMSSDCITDNIVAKFDRGLLLVTMPKLAKDQLPMQAVSTPAPHAKPAPKAGVLATPGTDADLSKGRKPEDAKDATVAGAGEDEQKKEADQKAKQAVTSAAAADVGKKATAGAKEEARGQPEVDTRKTPEPPATVERAYSQPPPPALPPPSAEAEKLRRRPRQVLVDVLVAVIVLLVGLSLYLGHRCWNSPEEQPTSIRDGYP